jgi:hypothetical protein
VFCNFRDSEEADIAKERKEQDKGPAARAHELDELTDIYQSRGLSYGLARQVRSPCWDLALASSLSSQA